MAKQRKRSTTSTRKLVEGATKMGRPTVRTPEIERQIEEAILAGCYPEVAARAAGIDSRTFGRWLQEGARNPKGPLGDFCQRIQKAMAEAEFRDLARIDLAAAKNWQAAAWKLERRNPERWAIRTLVRVEVDRQIDRLLADLERELAPATFRQILAVLARSGSDSGAGAVAPGDPSGGVG